MIPYGRQSIGQEDIDAVSSVLRSDFLTQGPVVPAFEEAVAHRVGAAHAVAVNSATGALHIACLALGLGPGQSLWTVPNTFVASANCARYCGADVDFVDIDPLTWNMSVSALSKKLEQARLAGTLPSVVVPVHFSGLPTEQAAIWNLAQEYGFKVIEDASHAIGASFLGEAVGSCRWSHITVFSFHPVKIITSGEGGMALTNDAALAESMRRLRSHGITRDDSTFSQPSPGPWYYEQQGLGFNYRMTDIHAALGLSQLTHLEPFVAARNALARRYDVLLEELPLQRQRVMEGNVSAYHLYVVRILAGSPPGAQRRLYDALRERGIGVNVHYAPVHLQPYYRALGFGSGYCPEGEWHGSSAITLPLYPALTNVEQDEVVRALRDVL
ncbi:UDP-4-amino-4,6-dideoxy-N-acetyl-beta-L-altrosamine transaminase [Paludibacterium yongneupense]|uniref:UDP-4-amino-4, 6-dideoxy-N-acetyl-beta-L-altrosamine transaminase n=1 Tax=Paludibacterium yongneupense TaxID=400061 RepID=UPI00041FC558|nr:UDP-4-amino-4,6-dideoxy-N-acetyl-beta-L-altrosamine transaminase [Paludibacterium yongneupense]